jgi:hypothetical protein
MKRFFRMLFGHGTSHDYTLRIIGDAHHLSKYDLRDMAEYFNQLALYEDDKKDDWSHLEDNNAES